VLPSLVAVRSTEPIVYVVDDDSGVREAICGLLASAGLRTEGFATAMAFLAHARVDAPSCLVLDLRLPRMSGLDLQREINRTGRLIPIVFVTGHGDVLQSVQAMKARAVDYLTKPFRDEQLLDAIRKGIERDRRERVGAAELAELRACFHSLTPRQREVMALVVAGLLNKQAAAALGTSEIMVKVHRAQVMKKMKAPSLADLVRLSGKLEADRRRG
jgi:FixJ family two-component response regulator